MSLRISETIVMAGLLSLALVACGEGASPANQAATAPPRGEDAMPVDDGKADCAIGIEGRWAHDCQIDRSGDMLTLRHPDGGFRRLRIVKDGRGLVPADGAEAAKLRIINARMIEVTVGSDRYRLPATIAATAG